MALCLLLVLTLAWTAGAELRFASYYADHMVLQKEPAGAVLWGYGESGASVVFSVFRMKTCLVKMWLTVHERSKIWKVVLNPMPKGGPYQIEVWQDHGGKVESVRLKDVYFGDVWLCSGQSNMEMTVSQIFNASKELKEASDYPYVRVFSASLAQAEAELQDLAGIALQWSVPTAENLGHGNFSYFSAVCWLFGRYLFKTLKYPIGLVESSWGGTPVEAWSSKRALQQCGLSDNTEKVISLLHDSGPKMQSVLWNAMIHPLLNMTLRGAIWYQGEENTLMNTDLYNCTFPVLIDDWRKAFHEGSNGQTQQVFPFGFVQLSAYRGVDIDDSVPRIRWHQTADYGYVPNKRMPNTFMAVAIDLGDDSSPYGSIHPRDKQSVAYRLHLGARAVAYGEKKLIFQGPYPQKVQVDAAHRLLNISFGQRIMLHHSDNKTFEVCCFNQAQCKWKPVSIISSSSNVLTLSNEACPATVSGLRYAWTEWPCDYKQCPVYNTQWLPAPPFITFSHNNAGWIIS